MHNSTTVKTGFDHYRLCVKIAHQRTCQIIDNNQCFYLSGTKISAKIFSVFLIPEPLHVDSLTLQLLGAKGILSLWGLFNIRWGGVELGRVLSHSAVFCILTSTSFSAPSPHVLSGVQ